MSLKNLDDIQRERQRLEIEEQLFLKNALSSNDPDLIIKANGFLENQTRLNNKSYVIDPYSLDSSPGYISDRTVNDATLRRMAKAPVIRSIINTRIEQVSAFCSPQPDKYSTGFIIQKKKGFFSKDEDKLDKQDLKDMEQIAEFVLNCGYIENKWHGDDFQSFIRKIVEDTLTLDKMVFETPRTRGGDIDEFLAVDGSTMYFSDSYFTGKAEHTSLGKIRGEYPQFVQVYNEAIVAEFYPWELCFGIRNPKTSIYSNGYGESELETLINIVTSMLQADRYNSNNFKIGALPNGLFKVSGNVNQARLREFKRQWQSEMAGYMNSRKTGFIEADKMDYIDLNKSNKDMEFAHYQEYLVKIACAIYKISPDEIGFPSGNSTGSSSMFEASNEQKLKYSKDKGLKPLLKFIEAKINKHIVSEINDKFEFKFVGLEAETQNEELDIVIKKVGSFMGVKEARRLYDLPDNIDDDDIINNPVYLQNKIQKDQAAMMGGDESNEFMQSQQNEFNNQQNNPMMKEAQSYFSEIITE